MTFGSYQEFTQTWVSFLIIRGVVHSLVFNTFTQSYSCHNSPHRPRSKNIIKGFFFILKLFLVSFKGCSFKVGSFKRNLVFFIIPWVCQVQISSRNWLLWRCGNLRAIHRLFHIQSGGAR